MQFRAIAILGALLFSTVLFAGCAMLGAREDLRILAQASLIKGSVTAVKFSGKPICVLLIKAEQGKADISVVAHQVIYPPEEFTFHRLPGEYRLLAFADENEDLIMQSDEMGGWYGESTAVMVSGDGRAITDLRIELRDAADVRAQMPEWHASSAAKFGVEAISGYLHVGEVVSLDHQRFSPKAGELGMWEPVKFLVQYGGGVFFLEPFSRDKIPVLFVHGMGGCPQNFQYLIEQLDRNRFQPWLMQYPSGLRLSLPSTALANVLREMHLRYGFTRMHIVAHSMGGLVARDAINQLARQKAMFVGTFITLSTPWKGHPGTTVGVEKSPVVIPCWYDMAPNSPFLKSLPQTPLPDGTVYYQMFGHSGGSAMFAGESADGTLPLSSMSDLGMQDVAAKVMVFNESHMSILTSPDVAMRLNRVLASPEATPAQCP